jgi:hypothetical protein
MKDRPCWQGISVGSVHFPVTDEEFFYQYYPYYPYFLFQSLYNLKFLRDYIAKNGKNQVVN